MRIDLTPTNTPQLDRSQGSAGSSKAASDGLLSTGYGAGDVAHLSTGSDAVQQLKANLAGVPEVRQQRVNDLRQAIGDGTYQVSPDKVATAMLAETSRKAT